MRNIVLLLIYIFGLFPVTAKSNFIYAECVDSVEIRAINWFVMSENYHGVARKAFDELYMYLSEHPEFRKKEDISINRIIITDDLSKFLFCSILNNLPEYENTEGLPSPDEIYAKSKGFEYNMGLISGIMSYINGDPLEVRAQIKIYMVDGSVTTAYMSHTLLDIFNKHYRTKNLSAVLGDYLSYIYVPEQTDEGQPYPNIIEDFVYDGFDKIASSDSLCVYKSVEEGEWIKLQTIKSPKCISKLGNDILQATGSATNINPKMKIEFYINNACFEVFIENKLLEVYRMIYKLPYNIEEYIYLLLKVTTNEAQVK